MRGILLLIFYFLVFVVVKKLNYGMKDYVFVMYEYDFYKEDEEGLFDLGSGVLGFEEGKFEKLECNMIVFYL